MRYEFLEKTKNILKSIKSSISEIGKQIYDTK